MESIAGGRFFLARASSYTRKKTTTRRNVTKSSVCLIHNVYKPHRSRNQTKIKSNHQRRHRRRRPRAHILRILLILYFFLPLPFPLAARAAASSASRRSRLHRPSALSASAPLLCATYAPPTNVAVATANAALSVQNGMLRLLLSGCAVRRPSSGCDASSSFVRSLDHVILDALPVGVLTVHNSKSHPGVTQSF